MMQAVVVVGLVLGRAVVRDMYPQDQAASQIGYVTMGMAVVPMIGPAIGGVLDETLGWQANFWMLAILGLLVLALVWRDLGETAARGPASFAEQFAEYPELFASRRFWGYCLAAAFASGAFFAYLGGAPLCGLRGLRPLRGPGRPLFRRARAGIFLRQLAFGRYSVRVGINGMILWGTILSAAGLIVAAPAVPDGLQDGACLLRLHDLRGLGNGMVMPNATSGMLSVRPHLAGTASGLGGALMLGGGAALSALAGALLTGGNGAYPLLLIMLITSTLA
jgi:DHA1 family bicyclomycin/chloramphenicol resistance-like MFS transporter